MVFKIKPGKLIIDILKFILIIYIVFTLSILYDKTEYILKKIIGQCIK